MSLTIRPYQESDIATTIEWLNDKSLMRFSQQRHKTHTVESQRDYWRSFVYPNRYLALEDGSELRELIGTATIYVEDDVADIGTLIGVPGRGYGSEAFGHLIAIAFSIPEVRKVTGGTVEANIAMWKVYEHHKMKRDAAHTVLVYSLTRSEWSA